MTTSAGRFSSTVTALSSSRSSRRQRPMAMPSAVPSSSDSAKAAATRPSVIAKVPRQCARQRLLRHRAQHGGHRRQQPAVGEACGDLPGQQEHQRRDQPRRQFPVDARLLGVGLPSDRPEGSRWYGCWSGRRDPGHRSLPAVRTTAPRHGVPARPTAAECRGDTSRAAVPARHHPRHRSAALRRCHSASDVARIVRARREAATKPSISAAFRSAQCCANV